MIHRLSNLFNRLFHENRYCLTGKKRGSIMSLTINVREATNATILEIAGRLTLGASGPSLRDTVRGLLNLNKKTQDLMLLTKLYTVFAIYTDESTALMSFNVAPAHG